MADKARVLIFIVSYNAEKHIHKVLERVPELLWHHPAFTMDILIIDDESKDKTYREVADYIRQHPQKSVRFLFNPVNQGYGGNQKLGYQYAIKHGYDLVVLLHGDGQYAPEFLEAMITPILDGQADVMLGSRMVRRAEALRGKMPLYKWLGNQVLTSIQNLVLGTSLSEFHTGYRAYAVRSLKKIPFQYNSNYFDFDTDILIQMIETQQRIKEIEIPTFYGDEISHVNGLYYAFLIILTTLRSQVVKLKLFYDLRFDFDRPGTSPYKEKTGFPSSHRFAIGHCNPDDRILDLGCGPGHVAKNLFQTGAEIISIDREISTETRQYSTGTLEMDIETLDFSTLEGDFTKILLLDVLENLSNPEQFLQRLRLRFGTSYPPEIIITAGNLGFFTIRIGLLLGQFNYGKVGILDKTHRRLFTYQSLTRLLQASGFDIKRKDGLPAPYPLAIGSNVLSSVLLNINNLLVKISRNLFAYQIALIVSPLPTLDELLSIANRAGSEKIAEREGDSSGERSSTGKVW